MKHSIGEWIELKKSWYGANLNRHWTKAKQTLFCAVLYIHFSHFLASLNCSLLQNTQTHCAYHIYYSIGFLAVDMKQSHAVYRSSSHCASNTVNMNQCFYLGHNSYIHTCASQTITLLALHLYKLLSFESCLLSISVVSWQTRANHSLAVVFIKNECLFSLILSKW